MSLLRRDGMVRQTEEMLDEGSPEPSALRDEADPDAVVEAATERLRAALISLDARDEWGRALAWRQVARIVVGPLLGELRDAQTAAVLSAATGSAVPGPAPAPVELDLFTQQAGPGADLPLNSA